MLICNSANSPAASGLKQSRPIDRARVENRSILQTGSEELRLAKACYSAVSPFEGWCAVQLWCLSQRLKKISSHPLRGYQISRHVLFFPLSILDHPLTRKKWKHGSQRVQENLVKPISLHSVPDLPRKP